MSTLTVKHLKKSFGKNQIFENINLELSDGMYGLLGSNGVGKTTFMRTVVTLLKQDEGHIAFDGIDSVKDSDKMRQNIGYLPQQFGCYRSISAFDCLDYIGTLKGIQNKKQRKETIESILSQVNLLDVKDMKLKKYSGGMMRRFGIAQAMLGNPRLLIIDEPTAGLDPEERIRFRRLLRSFSKDRIVLISTHIVEDIQATCQGVATMKKGDMKYFTSLSELAALAEGKVWQLSIHNNKDYDALSNHGMIISESSKTNGSTDIRMVSENKPTPDAIAIEPTIEEGYLIWNKD